MLEDYRTRTRRAYWSHKFAKAYPAVRAYTNKSLHKYDSAYKNMLQSVCDIKSCFRQEQAI